MSVGIFVEEVVDGERNDLRIGVATGIGHFDGDVVGLIGLEVDVRAGGDANFIADDLEEARRVVGDGVGVAVACIRVDC